VWHSHQVIPAAAVPKTPTSPLHLNDESLCVSANYVSVRIAGHRYGNHMGDRPGA
jgi:hypothetical protein